MRMWPLSIFPPVGDHIPSSGRFWRMLGTCLYVAGTHGSLSWVSGSFKSVFDDMRATQTRPRFYVPSERRGVTLMSNTHYPHQHCPSRGSNPGPLAWEAKIIPLDQRCLYFSFNWDAFRAVGTCSLSPSCEIITLSNTSWAGTCIITTSGFYIKR